MSYEQQIDWPAWPRFRDHSSGDLTSGQFDAAELLWSDTEMFAAPRRNSLNVLGAIRRTLDQTRPLRGAEQEFLDLCAKFDVVDREVFAEVWSDPRAYHWTRRAHELTGACLAGVELPLSARNYCQALGEMDPPAALVRHLDQFKLFALGVAIRTGVDWTFDRPMRAILPLAIPGSRLSLVGRQPIEITGLVNGRFQTESPFELLECPVARVSDYSLLVHPHALNVPGLEIVEPPLLAGLEYHQRHVPLLEQTLTSIQRYAPALFAHFRRAIRIAALKPRTWGSYDDFSEPELPGSFIASVIYNPLEMADHLIHEFQHNRLSFIEECGPLFDPSAKSVSCYSPWRDKPRAPYGLYHGVYVFVAVSRYWLQVYLADEVPPDDRQYVIDRLLRLPRQLALGIGVLRRFAKLTPLGQTILEQLARDVEELQTQVARAGLPPDAPALRVAEDGAYVPELSPIDGHLLTARESVLQHVRLHDAHQQCDVAAT